MLAELGSPLLPAEATQYRALAARLNYLALDRQDIQFATKEVAKYMATPSQGSWILLKRLARYLVGAPRLVQHVAWQGKGQDICTYTDSDWAGDKVSRKSTSGGVVALGHHCLKSWSKTQNVIALSSGEAELYATNTAASLSASACAFFSWWFSATLGEGIKSVGLPIKQSSEIAKAPALDTTTSAKA